MKFTFGDMKEQCKQFLTPIVARATIILSAKEFDEIAGRILMKVANADGILNFDRTSANKDGRKIIDSLNASIIDRASIPALAQADQEKSLIIIQTNLIEIGMKLEETIEGSEVEILRERKNQLMRLRALLAVKFLNEFFHLCTAPMLTFLREKYRHKVQGVQTADDWMTDLRTTPTKCGTKSINRAGTVLVGDMGFLLEEELIGNLRLYPTLEIKNRVIITIRDLTFERHYPELEKERFKAFKLEDNVLEAWTNAVYCAEPVNLGAMRIDNSSLKCLHAVPNSTKRRNSAGQARDRKRRRSSDESLSPATGSCGHGDFSCSDITGENGAGESSNDESEIEDYFNRPVYDADELGEGMKE